MSPDYKWKLELFIIKWYVKVFIQNKLIVKLYILDVIFVNISLKACEEFQWLNNESIEIDSCFYLLPRREDPKGALND